MDDYDFKPGDRVVKNEGDAGPEGTVQNIRVEVVRSSLKPNSSEPPGIAITVLWDNGTVSHFVPEALKKLGKRVMPSGKLDGEGKRA